MVVSDVELVGEVLRNPFSRSRIALLEDLPDIGLGFNLSGAYVVYFCNYIL